MTPLESCWTLSRDSSKQDADITETVLWIDGSLGTLETQITKYTWFGSEEDVRVVVVWWFQRHLRYFWLFYFGDTSTTLSVGWMPLFLVAFTSFSRIILEWVDMKNLTFVCPCIVIIIANDDQQDTNILAYLFIPNQLYMFRAMSSPIIRSTWLYLQHLILSTDIAAS